MSNFDEIFARIKLATQTRTQIELAALLDIRQSSISDAKRRGSVPPDWFMKLFDRFGLNPDWVKKGSGPMYLRTETGYTPADAVLPPRVGEDSGLYADPNAKCILMNVYAMHPATQSDGEARRRIVGKLSVPLSLAGEGGIQIFILNSSSMEPLLCKGAYVGVDTSQKQVVSGELYATDLPYEGVAVKRIFFDSVNAQVLLRTENPQYPEFVLPFEDLGKAVLGRIVWTINRY